MQALHRTAEIPVTDIYSSDMEFRIRDSARWAVIGYGCTVKSALNEMTMIAEGYFASDCIRHINGTLGIDMPIADMVYDVRCTAGHPRERA